MTSILPNEANTKLATDTCKVSGEVPEKIYGAWSGTTSPPACVVVEVSCWYLAANVLADGIDAAHYVHSDTLTVALIECGSAMLASCNREVSLPVDTECGTSDHVKKVCEGGSGTEDS